ncbi:MAG: DUF2586 family protein [Spirochaetes bacterium]|nr:MAG: DUF2586 family protein [Spirochaetota bacterium]
MRGDVNVNLVDGGLGNLPKGADGIHLKVGVAEGGIADQVYEVSSYREAKEILISGKLLSAIETYYNEFSKDKKQVPPKMFFTRPVNDVAGSVTEPVKTGTGIATAIAAGTPTGDRAFVIEILKGGAPLTATYRKSQDGGKSWSDEITTPASASPINVGAGCTIAFTAGGTPATSFVEGDVWKFDALGPTASVANVLAAVRAGKQNYEIRFVHVVGATVKSFWVSCGDIADDWEANYHQLVKFICEATPRTTETVAEWSMLRINEAKAFMHKRVIAVALEGKSTLTGGNINLAWVLAAKIAAARVHESAGFVDKFAFLTISEIRDWTDLSSKDGGDAWLDTMDDNRLTVATQYDNYPGFYFSHANLMSDETSDYKRVQDLRPIDKVRRIARQKMMRFLESPAHPEAGIGGIQNLKAEVDAAIAGEMERRGDKEIDSHEFEIDPNQDVVSTGEVYGMIHVYKIGTMEKITVDVGYKSE